MASILAVANQKGGVGKTTTVVNLGAALAEKGLRVLLVDADAQHHLTLSIAEVPGPDQPTIYDVLFYNVLSPIEAVIATSIANAWLMPANSDLAAAEVRLQSLEQPQLRLRHALALILHQYDYVLIDTPPTLGLLTINALTAADAVLIPIECSYLALQGLKEFLDTYERVKHAFNPSLEICGILLTMHEARPLHTTEVSERLREAFPDLVFSTVIPRTIRFKEAPVVRQCILQYAPENRGAQAYRELAEEVLAREPKKSPSARQGSAVRAAKADR